MFGRRARVAVLLALVAGIVPATDGAAAKKIREEIWPRPGYAGLHVDRIAMIPAASYDNSFENETMVEAVLGPALKGTAYRWISGATTRELLRNRTAGDSLLKVVKTGILAHARVDSVSAPWLATLLRCDALLSVRVDLLDEWTPEWNQTGKPYRTVQLHAALVDSLGRLLWAASGTQTGEGPFYDPSSSPIGVRGLGSGNKPSPKVGGAPTYREVVTTLLTRWAASFPPRPAGTRGGASGAAEASGMPQAGAPGDAPADTASRLK